MTRKIIRVFSLLVLLITLSVAFFIYQHQQKSQKITSPSPLLFGTNIGLFNSQDSFLTQDSVKKLMKTMHVTTVRIPIRQISDGTPPVWPQALQDAKDLNLLPLLILPVSSDYTKSVTEDGQIITTVNSIMGKKRVFYEFGNEEDLSNGTNQYKYTDRWNQLVPALKHLAPAAWFGGPVTFQQNAPYVAYFYHHTDPKPDFISWHTYFCTPQSSAQACIANVAHFADDMATTKNAIQANGDSIPPIFITEWNYDATQGAIDDPRNTPQFQQKFVKTVLQEFAKDNIYAAYQYVLNSNPAFNLINTDNTTLTPAGQQFQLMYKQLITAKQDATPLP